MYMKSNDLRLGIIQGTIDNQKSIERYSTARLAVSLKEHQSYSLFYMKQLEDQNLSMDNCCVKTNVGIYSDCVGAGKSFTLLSLIGVNPKTKESQIHEVHGVNNVYVCKNHTCESNRTTLIVVPHSICKQWEDYIHDHTTFTYSKINNKKLLESFNNRTQNNDIVLVSSSMYNEFIDKSNMEDIRWNRVIFDEADSINIPSCMKPETNFTWFVTSSLQNLMFIHGYYYTIKSSPHQFIPTRHQIATRHFVNGIKKNGYIKDVFRNIGPNSDHVLKCIVIKNEDTFVHNSFQLEDPVRTYIHCANPVYMNIIDSVVNREVLQRLNAGDKSGAIEAIGNCNVNTLSNIVDIVTQDIKHSLLNHQQELIYVNSLTYNRASEIEHKNKRLKDIQAEIDKYQRKLQGIEDKFNSHRDEMCPICMDTYEDPVACLTCCNNLFCMRCITECIQHKQTCPMCRSAVTIDSFNIIHDEKIVRKKGTKPTKMDALMKILQQPHQSQPMKTLVFSAYDCTFTNVENAMKKGEYKYCKISGNTNQINSSIQKYKNGDTNILLLNSTNFGSGLNLEMTTDIVFFHKMSKDIEEQVIGRGQRYGRNGTLRLHFLCYDNEINETV